MNLYLPVYKRLEDEVISLTQNIFFDDDQLSTYSLSIADIIIRCSIEIEAIAKELYVQLGWGFRKNGTSVPLQRNAESV